MDTTRAPDIPDVGVDFDAKQLRGIKPLRKLLPLLASLRGVGCGRDTAGSRELHFDQYVTLVLLWLFNPVLDSVRAPQLRPTSEAPHTTSVSGLPVTKRGRFWPPAPARGRRPIRGPGPAGC